MYNEKCFSKKATHNFGILLKVVSTGILLLFPFIFLVAWIIFSFPSTEQAALIWFGNFLLWLVVSTIADFVWIYIIGFPFIECYIWNG